MRKNKGVSLVILIITIIIMIIIAGTTILTLNGTDIFDKANKAADDSNQKQIKSMMFLAWAEAYLDTKITEDEQYRLHVEKKLKDSGIELKEYKYDITSNWVTIEGKDNIAPVVRLTTEKASAVVGGTLTYLVTFTDNNEVAAIEFDENDITLNGFTATKEVTGEGNTRTLILSNIQGEFGEKTITIKEGVAKDVAGNISKATTVKFNIAETLGALITSAGMYGKNINYEANGVTDWKVFYSQKVNGEEYVYLIASEMLVKDKVPTVLQTSYGATIKAATVGTKTIGKIYWASSDKVPSKAATIKNSALWMAKWGEYDSYDTNINGRCASYFLDENIWKDFANTEGYKDANGNSYVVGAIGTPTAEMFVASWNAIREATGNTSKYNKKLKLEPKGTTGYYINDITMSDPSGSNTTTQSISTSDSLYIWSTEANSSVWLASPSCGSANCLMNAYYSGYVDFYAFNSADGGARPVVCLKASIPVSLVDGNFVIQKTK